MEARAYRACERIKQGEPYTISVEWRRSRAYGLCPAIETPEGKAAYAGGCGYDKLSAVLCEFLGWLSPRGYLESSGAGESSVVAELAELGYKLSRIAGTKYTVDIFEIRREGGNPND
jgi:hypothetical protein